MVETRGQRQQRLQYNQQVAREKWEMVKEGEENSAEAQLEQYPNVEFVEWHNMNKEAIEEPWTEIWEERGEQQRVAMEENGVESESTKNEGSWMVRQAEQREGRLTIMTWNAEGLRSGGGARNSDERGTVVEEHSLRRVLVDMQEQGVDVVAMQEIRQSEATVRVMVRRLQLENRWKAYEFVVASTWGRTIKQRTLPKKWKAMQEGVEKEVVVPQSAVMLIVAGRIAGRITTVEKDEYARFCAVALEGEQDRRVVIMSGHAHYHSAAKEEVMREALAERVEAVHGKLRKQRMESRYSVIEGWDMNDAQRQHTEGEVPAHYGLEGAMWQRLEDMEIESPVGVVNIGDAAREIFTRETANHSAMLDGFSSLGVPRCHGERVAICGEGRGVARCIGP